MGLSAGTHLGPYEIVAPLGAGGMGEVYRALDIRLGRKVAIKVLPEAVASDPVRLRRFEQEARSASALNHPNIVTIYDVGQEGSVSYIAMELVEGQSLREMLAGAPLALKRVLAIGAQAAEGLAKAHSVGLVHRDLKPENVMITSDGLVKILDFGLAKLSAPTFAAELASQAPTEARATEPGAIVGTVGYMSPEQASGNPADFRSDQFSLGVILYEMATGVRPFQRASAIETLTAILKAEPPSLAVVNPDAPDTLRTIVQRCLGKEPERRYASTRDLARDLIDLRDRMAGLGAGEGETRGRATPAGGRPFAIVAGFLLLLTATLAGLWLLRGSGSAPRVSAAERPSIAILPFRNFGGRPEDEYFSDGMTESLITDLAKVKNLLVIARNSVFRYKTKDVDVRKVGEELGVSYVLEGSVQRAGDSVRVNAQLIDAQTGYHLWAEKYDRPMKDLLALQDDISRNIVGALKIAIASPVASPTSNVEAYDAYLRGMSYAHRFEWKEKDKSIPYFERATALDPGFARAHAALASQYTRLSRGADPLPMWQEKAYAEIEKALSLDPNLAEGYVARGSLVWSLQNHFPHERVAADLRRALEISPNLAAAHESLANLYYHVGLMDRGLEEYWVTLKLDPHNLDALYRVPRVHMYQQRYAEALVEFDATPQFADDFLKPLALDHLGRSQEAMELASRQQLVFNPSHPDAIRRSDAASTYAVVLARSGDHQGADRAIAVSIREGGGNLHFHHASYNIATAFALLGKKKEALEWLEKTALNGMPCYPLFEKDPFLDNLRGDPDFAAFLARTRTQWERFSKTL
jgi:TolB-like protein/Tfp pilus assembly protein PilF